MAIDDNKTYTLTGEQWKDLASRFSSVRPIAGEGAPTTATAGALGQEYLNITNGAVYVLTSIEEESGGGQSYNWEKIIRDKEACPIKISTADYDTTLEGGVEAVALQNLPCGFYIATEEMRVGWAISTGVVIPSGTIISISGYPGTEKVLVQFGKFAFLTQRQAGGAEALPSTNSEIMFLTGNDVINNLGGTVGVRLPISTKAVYDWKTQVEDMINRYGNDPVSGEEVLPSSHRILGQIWINSNTGKIYVLAKIEPGVEDPTKVIYTWEELGEGVEVIETSDWSALWEGEVENLNGVGI